MAAAAHGVRGHRLGVLLMVLSALAFSTAGFFSRLITLDAPNLLFWRGIFSGLTIALFVAFGQRGGLRAAARAMGWAGLLLAGIGSVAMITFIWSLRVSSVAEVSVIYATAPLATAALSWLLLGERAGRLMLGASAVCLAGMAVMMSGAQARAHLWGDLLAAGMTLASALFFVVLRWRSGTPTAPALGLAAFVTAVVMLPWATPLSAAPGEIAWTALFGALQNGLGLILMAWGARFVSASENALYGALDAPLAPLWVWLAFGEAPSLMTLLGGALVIAAVLGFLASGPSQGGVPKRHSHPV